CARSNWDLDYW
nr:immunoglobulin heavy chain junction region [Mus musculus]NSM07691.1 immunoglobulin heavy chain junction region [Mus musculus]NSM08825.1 immunoglobulin heavy chain junction region [Mus musculus]